MRAFFAVVLLVSLPLPALAKTVLLLGDSHLAGTFGKTLDRLIRKTPGMEIHTEASCGSILYWWYTGHQTPCGYLQIDRDGRMTEKQRAPTPLLTSLLDRINPNLVVIEMGANYIEGYPEATLRNDVARFFRELSSRNIPCAWIGPPASRSFRSQLVDFVPKLESMVASSCQWIDSRLLTSYPDAGGDGDHFDSPGLQGIAVNWAQGVFQRISDGFKD